MEACPGHGLLLQLIERRLDASTRARVADHVETCPRCRSRLAELDRGEIDRLRSGEGGSIDTVTAPGRTLVRSDPLRSFECEPDPRGERDPGATTARWPADGGEATVDRTSDGGEVTVVAPGPDPQRTTDLDDRATSTDAANEPMAPAGRPEIPGYDLLGKLGEGGMGIVYKARQRGLNRLVALKMIRHGGHARRDSFDRLRVEAEAVARLRHPNLLQIHDIGEVDGLPFVVLELLAGGSLADRLAGTPQPAPYVAGLMITLSRAMDAAHQAGIIHRDLKPANVLFSEEGTPRITDFGLAKRMELDSDQTASGQILGSPSYMAPEQARGQARDVTRSADVYALGAILYEMLTGRPPFKGESPMDTIRQVLEDEVVPPSRLVPSVARDLETICLKCLSKEPARRYASALALAEDLERYRDGEPILARRASAVERGMKWARRRPSSAILLALGAAAFLGLTAGGALLVRGRSLRMVELARKELDLRKDADRLMNTARQGRTPDDWVGSQRDLSSFLGRLQAEDPALVAGLPAQIEGALAEVGRKLRRWNEGANRQQQLLREQERSRSFDRLRAQAQLHTVEFVVDPADRLAKLRDVARSALAVYAADPRATDDRWSLAPLPSEALSEGERARIVDGCYELLLLLSGALEDPRTGLRVLDRAARLRPQPTAAFHLRRADCLGRAGDRVGRRREEGLAARLPARSALDHFLIGRERLQRGRWREAIDALQISARLDPDQTGSHLALAIAEVNARPARLGEALGHLDTCVARHPDLVWLYLLRARVHGEEGNEMLDEAGGGRGRDPASARGSASSFEAAEDDYRTALRALELKPNDDFRYVLLVNRGGMRLQAGRLDESLADLEAAIRLRPDLPQADMTLAQLRERQGDVAGASRAFARALERTTDRATRIALYRTRARLHADRRDATPEQRAEAIRDLDEAIRLAAPDLGGQAEDQIERAKLLLGEGRFEEALEGCDRARRLAPDRPAVHELRISALMGLQRFDEVLAACDAYLSKGPPTVEVLEVRGLARVTRQDYPGAIADFTRAAELGPDVEPATRARLLNHRGWAHHFADAPRLALADFEASLRLVEGQADAHSGRGLARIRLGDWRAAVADAEAALRLSRAKPAGEGDPEHRLRACFNAARIYAQAVDVVAGEVSHEGERAVSLYRAYRARSQDLLRQALEGKPPAERARMLSDPALKPLRPRLGPEPRPRIRPAGLARGRPRATGMHSTPEGGTP
jgi:tetratricopeptide (TPR) repeat protein/tRNA A-37 threonylcarbamoyl transferase component Bud32